MALLTGRGSTGAVRVTCPWGRVDELDCSEASIEGATGMFLSPMPAEQSHGGWSQKRHLAVLSFEHQTRAMLLTATVDSATGSLEAVGMRDVSEESGIATSESTVLSAEIQPGLLCHVTTAGLHLLSANPDQWARGHPLFTLKPGGG